MSGARPAEGRGPPPPLPRSKTHGRARRRAHAWGLGGRRRGPVSACSEPQPAESRGRAGLGMRGPPGDVAGGHVPPGRPVPRGRGRHVPTGTGPARCPPRVVHFPACGFRSVEAGEKFPLQSGGEAAVEAGGNSEGGRGNSAPWGAPRAGVESASEARAGIGAALADAPQSHGRCGARGVRAGLLGCDGFATACGGARGAGGRRGTVRVSGPVCRSSS